MVKNLFSNGGDAGLILGQGTEIPSAAEQRSPCAKFLEPVGSGAHMPQLESPTLHDATKILLAGTDTQGSLINFVETTKTRLKECRPRTHPDPYQQTHPRTTAVELFTKSSLVGTFRFSGHHLSVPRFAWQSNKAILFYFMQESVWDSVQHWCTEAEFWASNSCLTGTEFHFGMTRKVWRGMLLMISQQCKCT